MPPWPSSRAGLGKEAASPCPVGPRSAFPWGGVQSPATAWFLLGQGCRLPNRKFLDPQSSLFQAALSGESPVDTHRGIHPPSPPGLPKLPWQAGRCCAAWELGEMSGERARASELPRAPEDSHRFLSCCHLELLGGLPWFSSNNPALWLPFFAGGDALPGQPQTWQRDPAEVLFQLPDLRQQPSALCWAETQ